MMSTSTEKVPSGLTVKAIVFGVVYTLFMIVMLQMVYYKIIGITDTNKPWLSGILGSLATPMAWKNDEMYYSLMFLCVIIPLLISSLLPEKYRFNSCELAFIYAMIIPVGPIVSQNWCYQITIMLTPFVGLRMGGTYASYVTDYMSPLFSPKDLNVLNPMLKGGAVVPWDAWAIPIGYWIFYILSLYLCWAFVAGILRKIYVDVEALYFPLAKVTSNVMTLNESKKPTIFKSKFLWIGVLVSVLFAIPLNLQDFKLASGPIVLYGIDLTPLAMTSAVLVFIFEPWTIGWGLQLPNDLLLTCAVSYILMYMILPPMWVSIGWLTALVPGRHFFWFWNNGVTARQWLASSPVGQTGYVYMGWGIMFALVIYPLIIHKSVVIGQIRGLISPKKEEDVDARINWIGAILFGALYVVALSIVNIPVYYALLATVVLIYWYTSFARMFAETGVIVGGFRHGLDDGKSSHLWSLIAFGSGLTNNPTATVSYNMTVVTSGVSTGTSGGGFISSPLGWIIDSYAVGNVTKTKNRHILFAQIVGLVMAVAIGYPFVMYVRYWMGTASGNIGSSTPLTYTYTELVQHTVTEFSATTGAYILFVVSAILTVLLFAARARYGGIFNWFTPAGIVLSMLGGTFFWCPFIVALIVKTVVYKIGGATLYEKIVRPLGIGLMLGFGLMWPFIVVGRLAAALGWY